MNARNKLFKPLIEREPRPTVIVRAFLGAIQHLYSTGHHQLAINLLSLFIQALESRLGQERQRQPEVF